MNDSKSRRARPDPKRVTGYIRVSTEDQNLGPEAQREAIQRWCEHNNASLVAVHMDLGVSGAAPLERRGGLVAALQELKDSACGVLLVAKRDRLARDTMVAAMVERLVERSGARLLSADGVGNGEGPEALLIRGMIDVFAQYERALIRSRTKGALAVKKARGERVGGVPVGFAVGADKRLLVVRADEQETIVRISALRDAGLTIRQIADQLNVDNIPARGRCWHATTVARVLSRAA